MSLARGSIQRHGDKQERMSVLAEHRHMHRYSDEDVAAVVLAAVAELRRRTGGRAEQVYPLALWDELPAGARAARAEIIRETRSGVLPRERYEAGRREHEPSYASLPAGRRDEDDLLWMITQALTRGE
jgi:hypothetical protein